MAGGRIDVEVGVDGSGFASKFRNVVEGGAKGAFGALAGIAKTSMIAAGTAAGGLFAASLAKGWGRLTSIEDAQAKLKGLGHSAEDVTAIMDNALASVKGTAFGLGDAATIAASVVAAGIKPGEELERTLKNIADAATISGTSMGEMGAIFNKVAAGGVIQGEELAQLGDRGIPILSLLADQLGVTSSEVKKLASEGKIDFETFQKAMEAGMGGAALKSAETTRGAIANFSAALSRAGASMLSGVFPQVREGFVGMTKVIDSAAPAFENFGLRVGIALSTFRENASDAAHQFMAAFTGNGGTGIAGTLGNLAHEASEKLGPLGDTIKTALGDKATQAGKAFQTVVVPALEGAFEILSRLADPLADVAKTASGVFSAGWTAAGRAVQAFADNADGIADGVETIAEILAGTAENALPLFVKGFEIAGDAATAAVDVLGALNSVLEPLAPVLEVAGTAAVIFFAAFKGYGLIKSAGESLAAFATATSAKFTAGLQNAGAQAMVLTERIGAGEDVALRVGSAFDGASTKVGNLGASFAKAARGIGIWGLPIAAGAVAVFELASALHDKLNPEVKNLADAQKAFESAMQSTVDGAKSGTMSLNEIAKAQQQAYKDMEQARKDYIAGIESDGFLENLWESFAGTEGLEQVQKKNAQQSSTFTGLSKVAARFAYEALPALTKAQLEVKDAQDELNVAVGKYGPSSAQAQAASEKLAGAQTELANRQKDVDEATRSATAALMDQATQALAATNASLGLQQAQLNAKQTIEQANAVLADGTSTADERAQAEINLQKAFLDVGAAAEKKAAADNVGATADQLAGLQAIARNQAMLDLAKTTGVDLPESMQAAIAANNQTAASAMLTEAAFGAVKDSIVAVPDSKSVVISDNSPETVQKLTDLGYKVEKLPDGNIKITATDLATPAAYGIAASIGQIVATIKINGKYTGPPIPTGDSGGFFNAQGNVLDFYARGGFKPMRGGLASIVAPNTWRVVGDNPRFAESYIPIDPSSARSRALLEETARRMGYVIQKFATGGMYGADQVAVADPGPTSFIGDLHLDGQVFRGVVRGEVRAGISEYDRAVVQRSKYGTGA